MRELWLLSHFRRTFGNLIAEIWKKGSLLPETSPLGCSMKFGIRHRNGRMDLWGCFFNTIKGYRFV